MKKSLIIISGVSGSGKSMMAERLAKAARNPIWDVPIYTADSYFEKDGEYNFDPSKLGEAHKACQSGCESAMEEGCPLIFVNNTTTIKAHADIYINLAEKYGYVVHWVATIPHHSGENSHEVPPKTLAKQSVQLTNTFTEMHRKFTDD